MSSFVDGPSLDSESSSVPESGADKSRLIDQKQDFAQQALSSLSENIPSDILIHNYLLSGSEFKGWKLTWKYAETLENGIHSIYCWGSESDEKQAFKVEVFEAGSYAGAKKRHEELIINMMRPLEEFTKADKFLGADSYVDDLGTTQYSVFRLANIVVRIMNLNSRMKLSCNEFIHFISVDLEKRLADRSI